MANLFERNQKDLVPLRNESLWVFTFLLMEIGYNCEIATPSLHELSTVFRSDAFNEYFVRMNLVEPRSVSCFLNTGFFVEILHFFEGVPDIGLGIQLNCFCHFRTDL